MNSRESSDAAVHSAVAPMAPAGSQAPGTQPRFPAQAAGPITWAFTRCLRAPGLLGASTWCIPVQAPSSSLLCTLCLQQSLVWQIWRYSREFVEKYTANFILITNSVLNPHTFFRNTFHDLPYRSLRVLRLCLQMSPLDFDIKLIKSKHSKAGHWPSG